MNWLRIFIISFFFNFLSEGIILAQNIWTIEKCINYAWKNNFSIHQQELDVQIKKIDHRQAIYDLLPEIKVQSSLNQNFGRSIDPSTNTYVDIKFLNNDYVFYSSVDLFNGFMKLNTIAMQQFNYQAEQNKLQQFRNEVAFAVINSYFNLLLQMGLVSIAQENFQLSIDQLNCTKELVKLGKKPGTDLLETEANFAADSFHLIQSYTLLEQASLGLKYQMNFPVTDSLQIDTLSPLIFLGTIDTLSMEELFNKASDALPDIKVVKNQMLAAKKGIQVSRSAFTPRIYFSSGWNSIYTETDLDENKMIVPFNKQISNKSNEYLSLGLELPIFSKFSKYTTLHKSKLQFEQSKIQYDEVNYKMMMNVKKSLTEWYSARAEYESSLSQLLKNRKAFDSAEKKLKNGLISIIEYDIQKNKLFKAKTEVLRTGLQLMLKERYIRFLMTGSLLSV